MQVLKFVIERSISTMCPIGSEQPPDVDHVYELRSIPGGLIGCGRTHAEAKSNLEALLKWTLRDVESPPDWYRKSWARVSEHDHRVFAERVAALFRDLEPEPTDTSRGTIRGVNFSTLDQVAC